MTDELRATDTHILVIGGGSRAFAAIAARLLRAPFPVLVDPHRHVYASYGFERIIYLIQRSGTVLIDRDGIVRYVRGSANPRGALDRDELREQIRRLGEEAAR
jgi:peroxiredoxin